MTTFLDSQIEEFKEFSNNTRAIDSYGKAMAAMISQASPKVYRFNPISISVAKPPKEKDPDFVPVSVPIAVSDLANEDNKEYSDVLSTVDINRKASLTLLHSKAVSDRYKYVSDDLKKIHKKKKSKKRMIKDLMRRSVFHGRSWMGENFIA